MIRKRCLQTWNKEHKGKDLQPCSIFNQEYRLAHFEKYKDNQ